MHNIHPPIGFNFVVFVAILKLWVEVMTITNINRLFLEQVRRFAKTSSKSLHTHDLDSRILFLSSKHSKCLLKLYKFHENFTIDMIANSICDTYKYFLKLFRIYHLSFIPSQASQAQQLSFDYGRSPNWDLKPQFIAEKFPVLIRISQNQFVILSRQFVGFCRNILFHWLSSWWTFDCGWSERRLACHLLLIYC